MPSASGLHRQRLLPAALEAHLIGAFGRASGLLLLTVLAAVWASIVSWSVSDPSLTHVTGGAVRNALGAPGAIVADLLIQTLGLASAVALFPIMIWGVELVVSQQVASLRTKVTYYPLALLALAGGVSALPMAGSWPLEHGYGGILGDVIFGFFASIMTFISSDTAAIAAAILLFGIGLSSLAQAAGLKREHIPFAGLRRDHTIRHSTPELSRPAEASWTPPRARSQSLMSALGTLSVWGARDVAAAPRTLEPMLPGSPVAAEYARSYSAGDYGAPPQHAEDRADFSDAAPDDFGMDDAEPDTTLDYSSRAMAERFAPAGARPAPVAPPMDNQDLPRFMRNAGGARDVPREAAPAPSPVPSAPVAQASQASMQPVRQQQPVRRGAPAILKAIARKVEVTFKRPAASMLKRTPPSKSTAEFSQTVLRGTARLLEDVLADFGVKGEVRDIKPGPVVTLYELEPARGTKATRIMALADDIARSMSATSARVAVIPGRNVIGIELPNSRRDMVGLRELIESPTFASADGVLPLTLGRSIGGEPVIADLARMPHLLVAGTTGSGKSVGVNAMILSILFRHTPEQCRFIMIDPKMLELSVYNDIPHLLTPVVTDPQKAVAALNWVVGEMEERYKRMAKLSVRNIEAFNTRVSGAQARGEQLTRTVQTGFDAATGKPIYEREDMDLAAMAYIVVVVDEFADLMITAGKDIETAVQRLAQKARAAGIHLIMATQRPSVDIITGTIKANFPTRISFKVASKIDSRTILNEQGAEQLLGQGDMLYTSGAGQMLRVHGPFVSDEEVEAVAAYLRTQGAPRYIENIDVPQDEPDDASNGGGAGGDGGDSLYDRAVAVVLRDRKASTSYVQRRLSIGYNRAADLIERMERDGLISAPNHTGRREILAGEGPVRSIA